MENVFVIEDSLTNKISYYHLLALLFSLPFDLFYSHIILVSFALHTLIHLKKDNLLLAFKPVTLILQSVFWVTLIGISYSPDRSEGLTELGRQSVILVMPVLLFINPLNLKKYRNKLLLGFALCITVTVIYLFGEAVRVIRFFHYPLNALFSAAFTNHNFSDLIEMHATFFSLQVGLALVYLVSCLPKVGFWYGRVVYGICSLILLAGLIQLSSKSACMAVLVSVGLVIPFFIISAAKRTRYIIAGILITIVAVVVLSKSAAFKERYVTDLKQDLSQATANEVIDPRLARWSVALELAKKSPVIGYGSGSEIELLKQAYFKNKLYSSFLNGLNAHNEYLSFLLKSGILGLIIYLGTLAYGFKQAITSKNVMFMCFMLLVAMVSLSENMMDVDKGTMFYGLFFVFFIRSKNAKAVSQTNNYLTSRATEALV